VEQPTNTTERGVVLDDRYRLEHVRAQRELTADRLTTLWLATDVALDRRVAVLVVSARTKRARREVADAATRASRVTDGRCVRVLDIGEAEVGGETVTWVATEWVDAPSLAAVLRRAPMRPPVAVELVRQCAQALSLAEEHGARHGRLHPDEILLPAGGLVRITGLETAAARAGDAERDTGAHDDVRGLGALLFAALTGRWPLPGWSGLPPPEGAGTHPRAQVSSVPREVDEVTARALHGGYPDVSALARALGRLEAQPLDAPEPPRRPGPSLAVRRWAWRLVPPMLVVVIAAAGWIIGSDLGRLPQSARARHEALPAASPAGAGAGELTLVWRTPPQVTSFDPQGDGQENEDAAGFAVDHDPTTAWTTDLYKHSSHFGGLKPGVGLLIDLGRPTAVRQADLLLTASGSDVELRAGDTTPQQAGDLPLVASAAPAPAHQVWTLARAVTARYWLIWFTNLPRANGGYRIGITDVALLGPRAG
jgi:hypothetical protein